MTIAAGQSSTGPSARRASHGCGRQGRPRASADTQLPRAALRPVTTFGQFTPPGSIRC